MRNRGIVRDLLIIVIVLFFLSPPLFIYIMEMSLRLLQMYRDIADRDANDEIFDFCFEVKGKFHN